MKLLKDLGMIVYAKGIRKVKCGLYECPNCFKSFKARVSDVNNEQRKACQICSILLKTKKISKANTKHGYTGHPIHNTWRGMIDRCYKPSCQRYTDYGGKGITICQEWLNSFETFKDWSLNNGWEKGLQIDKDKLCYELQISPKIYSPNTCLWVTAKTNVKYRELYPDLPF